MIWNNHYRDVPEGAHAFLSASKYQWINDSPEELLARYYRSFLPIIGTVAHDFAKDHIKYGMKLTKFMKNELVLHMLKHGIPDNAIRALDLEAFYSNVQCYVNDAVEFDMVPEQPLYYSEKAFGTADAIAYDEERKLLRIHDLKTGAVPASLNQLEIYAAYFFLEYKDAVGVPGKSKVELRIYQNNGILIGEPTAADIVPLMDRIVYNDKLISNKER